MAYKVLIIGCGAIAGGYDAERASDGWPLSHAGAVTRDDRFELAACVDPDDAAREAFAARWSVPKTAPSLGVLAPEPGAFDVIVIASPTPYHAEQLDTARSLGPKLVFCEKPLATSFAEAQRVSAQYQAVRIPLAVNYTRRWAPDLVQWAKAAKIGGQCGKLISAVGTYTKGIVHNGSHMVDLIAMLTGPMRLQSVGPARFDHWVEDPTVSAVLTNDASGAPIHLVAGDARVVTQFELVMTFERVQIAVRDGGMRIETRDVGESPVFAGYRQLGLPASADGRYPEAMMGAYDNIARTLENGDGLMSDARTALYAQDLCETIRRNAIEDQEKVTP